MINRITIETQAGGFPVDVTDRLISDSRVILTQEVERGEFERVVSDCQLELSDMDGWVANTFGNAKNTSRRYLRISSPTRDIFYGVIKPTDVERSTMEERVRISAFSIDRAFWDAAKTNKIGPLYGPNRDQYSGIEVTIQHLLERDLLRATWVTKEGLFSSVDTTVYAARMVRDYANEGNNLGRWREMDPKMTWADFLAQIALYYNCEFYIDHARHAFIMARRNATPATYRDITALIVSDQEYRIQELSTDAYDALYAFGNQTGLEQSPIFLAYTASNVGQLLAIDTWWIMTCILIVGGIEVETMPGPVAGPFRAPWEYRSEITLRIPPVPYSATTRRRVYMRDDYSGGQYYLKYTTEANDSVDILIRNDTRYISPQITPPSVPILLSSWHRYNEETGQWDTPILDIDNPDPPSGRVKDVRPILQFTEIGNPANLLQPNTVSIFQFFRNDLTNDIVREQYIDLFLSRPLIELKVEDTDWMVGDGVSLANTPGIVDTGMGTFKARVKKATIDMLEETTVLEVVPI